ncbi:MAG: FAD-dependent oxidoreductase [Bacteroidota bacterium]
MSEQRVDYIVVGQGLAGTALSKILIKNGKKIALIDQETEKTSSKVAAGLYNPVTGRKLVRTWKADKLFPFMIQFYQGLEKSEGSDFMVDLPIYRPFLSIEQQNEWMAKSAAEEYALFVRKNYAHSKYDQVMNDFGGVELAHSGYLNVPKYLKVLRSSFEKLDVLMSTNFDFSLLNIYNDKVVYQHLEASKIIFCEGPRAVENPFFNWLPFRCVKGEVLDLKSELEIDNIVNRGVFVIPKEKGLFKVGSNYDNNDMSWHATHKARKEIVGKLEQLVTCRYNIVSQKAGIRPATKDRKPFIGLHPKFETVGIFNGLGAKGVSLAPYFAQQFYNYLEHDEQLDTEVNISRYFSLYS